MATSPVNGRATPNRATMKDVAMLAGVGIKTVSRVVNLEPNVTESTARRVREAIETLGFRADMSAVSLRRSDGRTRSIGLLVSSVDNPFAGELHRAVEEIARERGVVVLSASLDEDWAREEELIDDLIRRRVDGIILDTTAPKASHLEQVLGLGIPIVLVDRFPEGIEADAVTSDNRDGAATATRHLLNQGHRRIAVMTEHLDVPTAAERFQGYCDEMQRAGLVRDPRLELSDLRDQLSAQEALEGALAGPDRPTAVLSMQNVITVGALHALRSQRLEHSIAFVSFDDVPLADLLNPGVTVIKQNVRAIGQGAAKKLFMRLDGDNSPLARQMVPTELIQRGSGEIRPL